MEKPYTHSDYFETIFRRAISAHSKPPVSWYSDGCIVQFIINWVSLFWQKISTPKPLGTWCVTKTHLFFVEIDWYVLHTQYIINYNNIKTRSLILLSHRHHGLLQVYFQTDTQLYFQPKSNQSFSKTIRIMAIISCRR